MSDLKAIMYHYVRPASVGFPHFPYLSLSDFERQLDHFMASFGVVDRNTFEAWITGGPAPSGVLLTFDDGFVDHTEHVLPVLRERGLFGLFYVPSGPIMTGRFLDVHKIHLAVGKLGGKSALDWIADHHPALVPEIARERVGHYATQSSDFETKRIKYLLNWQLSESERRDALNGLFEHAFANHPPEWQQFYLDEKGVKALLEAGMGIGGHGHFHVILSRVDPVVQRREIEHSTQFVRSLVGHLDWGFCYAHGASGNHSRPLLKEQGWRYAFGVEERDIEESLSRSARWSLPRHNCNSFPYGSASFGEETSAWQER